MWRFVTSIVAALLVYGRSQELSLIFAHVSTAPGEWVLREILKCFLKRAAK